MAYMSQENKKELAPAIKVVLKKYNMKGSIAVQNYSTLVVNLREGKLDIIKNYDENAKINREAVGDFEESNHETTYLQVNQYSIDGYRPSYSGKVQSFLLELREAMMKGNYDNSDVMTDLFDVGFYISINVGKWNKPYKYVD